MRRAESGISLLEVVIALAIYPASILLQLVLGPALRATPDRIALHAGEAEQPEPEAELEPAPVS